MVFFYCHVIVDFGFDYRAFVAGAVAFPVDDPYTFALTGVGVVEELQELLFSIPRIQAVEVEFAGDAVMPGA